MKRKQIVIEKIVLSVDEDVSIAQAKREIRCRVNDSCCYDLDEDKVRVRSVGKAKHAAHKRCGD